MHKIRNSKIRTRKRSSKKTTRITNGSRTKVNSKFLEIAHFQIRRRQQELDTKAAINIAEGSKTSAILHSEGELEAQRNKASGERVKMEEIAQGWANQIKLLSESMQTPPVEAAKFIAEMKRLENLGEVAKGPNNSTYFFPQKEDMVPQSKMVGDLMKDLKKGVEYNVSNQ